MNKYIYKAKDWRGKTVSGLVEARNFKEAVNLIKKRNLIVVNVISQKTSFFQELKLLIGKVSGKQVTSFTRRLATMIEAGLPLTSALEILARQETGKLRQVIEEVLASIEGGSSLTQALEKEKDIFGEIYISSIRAGEAAGVLDKVLLQLADNLEKKQEFLGRVKGAMIYPIIVIVGMCGVIFIVMTFVIPKMTALYSEFGAQMPLPTRILMTTANAFSKFFWLIPVLVGGLFSFFKAFGKKPKVKTKLDEIRLKIPILGPLLKATLMTDITRTLGMLISTGVPLVDGVSLIGRSTGNIIFENAFQEVGKRIEKGFALSEAMREQMVFPDILVEMAATGEQTGKLDTALFNLAHYFEVEADQKVKTLTSAIEPLIMIVLGISVGFLVFAIIMPIYNLTSQF